MALSISFGGLGRRMRGHWHGTTPHPSPLIYLTPALAIRETVLGHPVTQGYRDACSFFGVGLIDRTGQLDPGFPVRVLDPIPDPEPVPEIAALCDQRAEAIVSESRERNLPIRLFWSGGIDSTAAAVGLLRVLGSETDRLEIVYSRASKTEYRLFFRRLKNSGVALRRINAVAKALTPDALLVTGEHGDQIFGSMLAGELDERRMFAPWEAVVPTMMAVRLRDAATESALAFLKPQIATCPIPLNSSFDLLWWWNFSTKWQTVSERLLAQLPQEKARAIAPFLRHFFRTDAFQRWALTNPDARIRDSWASYKWPLKEYIHAFTGDAKYLKHKEKERSLRGLLHRRGAQAFAIDADGERLHEAADRKLRDRNGMYFSFTAGE